MTKYHKVWIYTILHLYEQIYELMNYSNKKINGCKCILETHNIMKIHFSCYKEKLRTHLKIFNLTMTLIATLFIYFVSFKVT